MAFCVFTYLPIFFRGVGNVPLRWNPESLNLEDVRFKESIARHLELKACIYQHGRPKGDARTAWMYTHTRAQRAKPTSSMCTNVIKTWALKRGKEQLSN